jgi:iron complex outermembrane receptor protein
MPAMRSVATVRSASLFGALLLTTAFTVPAFAEVEIVVVTAEKRAQDVQTVPVAISVFGSDKRDAVGIQSIQDMTNFTPGLQYSTATDRISLRGVGRLTNVLSADAAVANYDDGLYETFAVAAGRSSLDLDRVEVLRGPQGTLYGRNAIAGALNEVTRHPSYDEMQAEIRATYGNYNHYTIEGRVSTPIGDNWAASLYINWDKQTQGFAKNIIPGAPQEYGVLDNWYGDGQIQAKFFGGKLDMWTKVQSARWYGGSGNAGSQAAGWANYDSPTFEFGSAATGLNPGYGCSAAGFTYSAAAAGGFTTAINATSPLPAASACLNPAVGNPWKLNQLKPYDVHLPDYESVNTQWTWHANNFDIKYIGGGTYYHYILTGGTGNGGNNVTNVGQAPITSYTINSPLGPLNPTNLVVHPVETFNYQEHNGFISNELNFVSTSNGELQWQAGLYQFQQHYVQPVFTTSPVQAQWNGPFGVPGILCAQTGGVCAPELNFRRFDNRPVFHASSEAAYFQLDWKATDELKFTGGLRYSADRKYGTENVRLLCFAVPACFAAPEISPFIAGGVPAVDLTQLGTVVASGVPGPLPRGVTGVTTYNAATGFASRSYHSSWGALTGTAGVDWTPDESSLVYGKYSRGYKSGGFNVGIFTVLSFTPWTDAEHVDSFEVGAKKTFGDWLVVDGALFHYQYTNLQIPILIAQNSGGFAQNTTAFLNVPASISQGFEVETTISPIEDLNILFNYSYDDAHISRGIAADPADPNATAPGAKPAFTDAQCAASYGNAAGPAFNSANPNAVCLRDIYTVGTAPGVGNLGIAGNPGGVGWNKPQNLHGNQLPNAAKNKIAINLLYTFHFDFGTLSPSVSYIWRDAQYGTLFTRSYNKAPSWDQVDARVRWVSSDENWEAIIFGKNILNKIGYDGGATGSRLAGTVDGPAGAATNFVQGVNNPAGFGAVRGENATGQVTTYTVTPPATWGIELHYKL